MIDRNTLIIAVHADDEILSCGGLLVKYGNLCHVVYVVVGSKNQFVDNGKQEITMETRLQEIKDTAEYLGFTYDILYKDDNLLCRLDTLPNEELVNKFEWVIEKMKPKVIYFPCNFNHDTDHNVVSDAVLIACRPRPLGEVPALFYCDEPKLLHTHKGNRFETNAYIELSESEIDIKLEALKLHKSQLREHPNMRSLQNVKAHAQILGSKYGVDYAEGYYCLRSKIG